jgi:predicted membrane channel-forming protein YqfA (hemolysin III family)
MQKTYGVVVTVVVILVTGFCVLIILSLIPYFSVIGLVATGVVFILLACISVLMVSFTWSRMGVWGKQRRLLVAGEIVVYLAPNGELLHLSATHEAAKVVPAQQSKALPAPKRTMDKAHIEELQSHGVGLRTIAEGAGMTYYEIQKIASGKSAD